MDKIALLSDKERKSLFAETAAKMKTVPAIVEKDFWVVWVLDKIFSHKRLKGILRFKGGTSLSKAFNLIGRFSEDIDLILDWRELGQADPHQERSKTQQAKFNEATDLQAKKYIRDSLFTEISRLLAPLCKCRIEKDDEFSILVRYPLSTSDNYLRPEILLEIGPLASWLPSDAFSIYPYVAEHFPELFEKQSCLVPTILAKRTFWEKATILHQEAHREASKLMPLRYSRHYYDLALLAQSSVRTEALQDVKLLKEVTDFKQRFYPCAWARYDLVKPGSFKLLPSQERLLEINKDYIAMEGMIFDKKITFEDMMRNLKALEDEINAL